MFLAMPVFAIHTTDFDNLTISTNSSLHIEKTFNLTINLTAPAEEVKLTPYSPLNISICPNHFWVDYNMTTSYTVSIDIKNNTVAGFYPGYIEFWSSKNVYTRDINITIEEITDYDTQFPKQLNVTSGEKGTFYFNITNTGNTNPLIKINTTYQYFNTKNEILLLTNRKVWVDYEIPENVKGKQNASIFVGKKEYRIPVIIKDIEAPKIIDIDLITNMSIDESYTAYVKADDNVGIMNVSLEVFNITFGGKKMGNKWIVDFDTKRVGSEVFTFNVCDESENCAQRYLSREIQYRQDIQISEGIEFSKSKVDTDVSSLILSTKRDIRNVTVKMGGLLFWNKDGELSNESEKIVDVSLVWKNSEKILRPEVTNLVDLNGDVFIKVHSLEVGRVEFSVVLGFPNGILHGETRGIDISAEFDKYSVPKPFDGELFGFPTRCVPYDLGSFQSSFVKCELTLPIDTNPKDLDILDIAQKEKEKCNVEKDALEKRIAGSNNWALFLTVILIAVGIVLFLKWQFPGFRLRM